MLNYSYINFDTVKLNDVSEKDYPAFKNARIVYAEYQDGIELDEDELEALNEDYEVIYEVALKALEM